MSALDDAVGALDQLEAAELAAEQIELRPEPDEPSVELAVPEPAYVPELVQPDALAIVPPEMEMRALVQLAVTLSAAELVPKALRDKPNDVLLVLLTARDLGIKLTTALRLCYPIEGQVTLAPKLKLAIVRERGVAKVWPDPANDAHSATWYARRADDPEITFESTITWLEAQLVTGRARLLDQRCGGPTDHESGCKCKDNWRNYPARMLSWRALGYLLDDACGEVAAGLYSPDELGAVTDEDGAVVLDVAEAVGPLPGTDEPRSMAQARRRRERAEAGDPAEQLAPAAERELIERMLRALPAHGLIVGRELWTSAVGVKVAELTGRKAKAARALVDSLWKRAEGGEWGGWVRPFDPDAPAEPESGSDAPESEPGVTAPAESSEAVSGDLSGQSGDGSDTIDSLIEWAQRLPLDEVDALLGDMSVAVADDAAENDRRRALAVRAARDAGLL